MMLANLRGTKESGRLFAPPVYTYIVSLAVLIGYGLFRVYFGGLDAMPVNEEALAELAHEHGTPFGSDGLPIFTGVSLFILLRAFSSGAVALTGVEAISNGVPAFKKPESKNAASTLVTMGLILGVFFMGISVLASNLKPTVLEPAAQDYQTLLSLMARYVYGGTTPLYYILQFATFAILILAANTAFADFPRVSSIIASDGYLPRQLANRGDRLVFSNGIVVLCLVAAGLIVAFGGDTSALIPLYAVGVFTGFTLSQAGMVIHHRKVREKGWRRNQIINAVGSVATFIVLLVVVVSKFTIGAWIPAVLIPLIVVLFKSIHRHYVRVTHCHPGSRRLPLTRATAIRSSCSSAMCTVGCCDAISYARSLGPDRLLALSVVHDEEQQADHCRTSGSELEIPVELRTVYSPYRELSSPVMGFIDDLDKEWPDDIITVVVPEFVLSHWWEQLLHNQSALVLRARLAHATEHGRGRGADPRVRARRRALLAPS